MKDKKILDLLRTAIGALSYLQPCNVSVEDYEYVITADNALREARDIVKGNEDV